MRRIRPEDDARVNASAREQRRPSPPGEEAPQLTLRAVVLGGLIGLVMCLSTLYTGLMTGVANGVAVTACLVSFGVSGALARLVPRWFGGRMGLLEDTVMQTTASAAGYATGSTIASVAVAHLLQTGQHIPPLVLLLWTFCCSALGTFFAVPLKRQLVDRDRLPFPSGTAVAQTLRALHGKDGGAKGGGRMLGVAAAVAALLALLRDGLALIPAILPIPGRWRGIPLAELTVQVSPSLLAPGLGALVGPRLSASALLGAVLCFGVFAPALHASGALPHLGQAIVDDWSQWPATALMASASLAHTVLGWRTLARGVGALWRSREQGAGPVETAPSDEIPRGWLWAGLLPLSVATVALAHFGFGIPPGHATLAVALSFVLAAVACRTTGETDGTPMLGQLTQLTFGALLPRNPVANLMTSSITGNSGAVAADLLTDLKAGQLLGASPRKQLVAQLIGCAIGSMAMVPFFYLLVPGVSAIGEDRFPAPAARLVLGVAQVMGSGLEGLSAQARWAMGVAAVVGVALTLAERLLPARWARFVPSPMGMGLGFLVPVSMTLGLFAGAVAMALLRRARPDRTELFGPPLASGLIAGESVMAVLAAVLSPSGLLH